MWMCVCACKETSVMYDVDNSDEPLLLRYNRAAVSNFRAILKGRGGKSFTVDEVCNCVCVELWNCILATVHKQFEQNKLAVIAAKISKTKWESIKYTYLYAVSRKCNFKREQSFNLNSKKNAKWHVQAQQKFRQIYHELKRLRLLTQSGSLALEEIHM